jgi:ATP-dependent Clp endopeptidase proteolytic subunit ClpP
MFNKRKFSDIDFSYCKKKQVKKNDEEEEKCNLEDNIPLILGKNKSDTKIDREYNHIYFHSEVTRESIFDLTMLIKEAEEECVLSCLKLNIDEIPIYLHINSYGGSIFAGFTAIDVINSCRVPIYTIVEGAVASAGTLMSIVGKKRYIRPNAYMLVHQLSSGCWGKMNEIEDEYNNLKDLMERIKDIYKNHTSIPKKELNEILKHDLWFNSDKCLKNGLVDEIWEK